MGKQGVDYDALGYSRGEAQARFDAQSAFCAAGGKPPWKTSSGDWEKGGKAVGDPAGPFNPKGAGKRDKKG